MVTKLILLNFSAMLVLSKLKLLTTGGRKLACHEFVQPKLRTVIAILFIVVLYISVICRRTSGRQLTTNYL